MKIAIISDIHGNRHALEAVLRHARGQDAAQLIINLGDSIGYGPNPEEIIKRIKGAGFINLLGDYDRKVISKKHRQSGWKAVKNSDKRAMFAWTYQSLSKNARRFIKALPKQCDLHLEGFHLLLTHGSPEFHDEHLGPDTPESRLKELAELANADVVLCGHSHQAFTRLVAGTLFLNPGSVGRPDDGDPRASYAILELREGTASAYTFRVPYNVTGVVQAMRRTSLPPIFTEVFRQGTNYNHVRAEIGQPQPKPTLEPCGRITLLTDFGLKDHFIGVMKGVIAKISPQTRVIDISHQIRPQNVTQAARMLLEAAAYFPPGTVHVAVVDPGVGTSRRALAARVGQYFYVAPDNGLLWPVLESAKKKGEQIILADLDQPKYWLPDPSASFHGRDIFSPVGAHLANGIPLKILGSPINDPVQLDLHEPEAIPKGWQGEVVMVDVFGNLSTNIPASAFPEGKKVSKVEIGQTTILGLTRAFGDVEPGSLIATIDSTGSLAISVVNGNAAQRLDVDIGTPIRVILEE
jgi:S-adenosyl-L-methionine hydrolase (adenosine-forming)